MIAVLQLTFANQTHFATLHDDGKWTCDDPSFSIILNSLFDPKEKCGPEHGTFGYGVVEKALKEFNGKVVWIKPREEHVERVY